MRYLHDEHKIKINYEKQIKDESMNENIHIA